MHDQLSEEELAAPWPQIAGLAGAYEGHGDTDVARAGDLTITNTPLSFEAGEFVARITFRDDQTIAGSTSAIPMWPAALVDRPPSESVSAQANLMHSHR